MSSSGLAVIRIVRALVRLHRRQRGRGAGLVRDRDQHAFGLRVQRGLEGVARAGAEQRRAGHRRVLAGAAAGHDDRLGLAQHLGREVGLGQRQDRRHEPGLGQDHLLHGPRRAVAQLGHVAHSRARYRLGGPSDRATSMPINRATLELFAALDRSRADAAAQPARGRDLRRDHRRRRAARHQAPGLAHRWPRRCTSRAAWCQRGLRADRRRGLDRDPPRRRARGPRRPGDRAGHERGQPRAWLRPRGSTSPPRRPISPSSRAGRGRRRCGGRSRTCRTPRSTTPPTRAGTPSCAPSWRPTWCACAGSPRPTWC